MGEKVQAETFRKGYQGEKDQNSELHTQYRRAKAGRNESQYSSLHTQRTRKPTGGLLYPRAHALRTAVMCHNKRKEFAFHKHDCHRLAFPTEPALSAF